MSGQGARWAAGKWYSPKAVVRYSGSIMTESPHLDPLRLTRQLCEIESTTYNEGKVGDFLADFLAARGWSVEKTAVQQPVESATAGPRWNVYAGPADAAPELVFSTHMDTVPPYIPFSEDASGCTGVACRMRKELLPRR